MSTAEAVVSFHNKQETKDFYLARAEQHFVADEIVKGQYWANGKGCAVGCLIHGSSHTRLADELGIPLQMAFLIDRLFEGMPTENAKEFPKRFIAAIPVGKDLEKVMDKFFLALLSDPEQGAILSANDAVRPQIQAVINLYTRQVAADYPTTQEWRAAYSAAYSAAYRAADSAAYSAAYRAAYRAACRAADSAACRAADTNHYLWQAEILLSLLGSA